MRKFFFCCVIVVAALAVSAHEYILIAANYRLKKGDELELHLFVADGFNIELERPLQKNVTKSFELITKDAVLDLKNQPDSTLPILLKKVDFAGGGLIHVERNYAFISLPNKKFFEYLKEDHLDGIAEQVNIDKPIQKERYSRYIKCLVQSEQAYSDTLYKKIVGQELEIILLKNPYQLKKGQSLPVQILFQGKPFVNRVVTARNRIGGMAPTVYSAKTNARGECAFVLNREGTWFIHLTQMISCPDKEVADWESFWASYSFGL